MKKCIYAYPWDFIDEGIDHVLETVKSKGVDTIAVASAYHAGKFILPHNPKRKVYFPQDGVVYFHPHAEYYKNSPIKPLLGAITEKKDLLAELARKCKQFNIKLEAWLVCLHNSRIGMKHNEFTVKNAYGDNYPYSLCPARGEVAEYIKGVISDLLENHPLSGVFLESLAYMGFFHGYHHEFYGIEMNLTQQSLLSLCFCDACKSEAAKIGLDVKHIADVVRENVNVAFEKNIEAQDENEAENKLAELIQSHPQLSAFIDMRCKIVTKLVSAAKTIADRNKVGVDFFGPVYMPSCRCAYIEGTSIKDIAGLVNHYVVPIPYAQLSDVKKEIEYVKERVAPGKMILSINMGYKSMPSKKNFLDKISLIREHNLRGGNFYNYGTVPLGRLDWLAEI